MLFALTSGAAAYALLGAGRGAVFPMVMVVLMFGMFIASPRQMRWVSAYAVLLFGAAMALMAVLQPAAYPWRIEIGHFLLVATMMPGMSLLAARLSRLRQRARQQRADLATCLDALLVDAARGTAYFKVYRQFKMYNDPRMNPALVQERRAAA